MQRLIEILLGLDPGFLNRQGDFSIRFNPTWPGQETVGAATWNIVLGLLVVVLVVYVYRREGRSQPVRVVLGTLRGLLLLFVLMLLNQPVLTLSQDRVEPSVVAILIDESVSMRVRDVGEASDARARLSAILDLATANDAQLLRDLAKQHVVRIYTFDGHAESLGTLIKTVEDQPNPSVTVAVESLGQVSAEGQNTQVLTSIQDVLRDLQGQRLAGVVVFTDGRETPARALAEPLATIKSFGVKVFPVPVGSDQPPQNIAIESMTVQDNAFKGDIVTVKVNLRASGYEPGHEVTLVLKDKKTGALLGAPDSPREVTVSVPDSGLVEAELQLKPEQIGTLDLEIEALRQPGELDDADNVRTAQISVLDARIAVLYVDGYPRWDYRYLKNEMMRDKTVDISCLLTSADATFAQEGDIPIRRFPESIEELMAYDVILFGDVDPRQFTDAQLQLVNEFVSKRGGGFGMVAGPMWSPAAFRGTSIESILPVNISRVEPEVGATITEGFRSVITTVGTNSGIFRFFGDKAVNERYLKEDWPAVFWYAKGATVKRGVGEAYAEHPIDTGPDGRKAPTLVLGRFGAGRTMFSAIDDSWRWRFYTGESIFNTFWVQQLRYLARSKKLGQRRVTLVTARPTYELGEQVKITMRVLDPTLVSQLPEQIRVEISEGSVTGTTLPASNPTEVGTLYRTEMLVRQEGENDLYELSYTADRVGQYVLQLPAIASGVEAMQVPITVAVPRLELATPAVDRTLLSRLASETLGQTVEFSQAASKLPTLLPSVAKIIPVESAQPLWDAPLALAIFAVLITAEWVTRKMAGML